MQPTPAPQSNTLTHPVRWPWALASPPSLSSDAAPWRGALLRCWGGTSPVMVQPPLDHHYVVLHSGGAKHVTRRLDGPAVSAVVANHALTLVPAGTAYVWQTQGPIAFAHLYLSPHQLEQAAAHNCVGGGAATNLIEAVGCQDPILQTLLSSMIREIGVGPQASGFMLDCLLDSVLIRLARKHASNRPTRDPRPLALAPHRLRRVFDFIDARLADDIALADLVAAAGSSQSHFCRAFRIATGSSPYRYLIQRRIELAKVLLLTSNDALETVARQCGFNGQHQFALMFKRIAGVGPKRFRLDCGTH